MRLNRSYRTVTLWMVLWIAVTSSLAAHAQDKGQVTPAKVQEKIDGLIGFLKRNQVKGVRGRTAGSWAGHEQQGTGMTSLVVLSLLSAGLKPSDPDVSKALTFIRSGDPKQVYEASLQVMVLCTAGEARDRDRIQKSLDWLLEAQQSSGGWAYEKMLGVPDESNSQFAVLALWEASRAGFTVPDEVLRKAREYWKSTMKRSGAWSYRGEQGARGSMTCAGIASMVILDEVSSSPDASISGDKIVCCGGDAGNAYDVSLSLDWLGNNFSVNDNPGSGQWYMYYMYALERVGRLTGQRFIGNHDWYREGSEAICQRASNVGGSVTGGNGEDPVAASAMALLFLSKGKRQIVIGQLQHGTNLRDWNKHRRAVQNMTGHVESVWKRDLSWQTMNLQRSTLADLLEAPVLFISGSSEFRLTEDQRKLLKEYTEQGGFIFAEACNGNGCDGRAFDASFRKEMELIFDKPLQKLPPTHPLWTAETRIAPESLPEGFWLYGLESCCKTSVVYSPISLTCRWELAKPYGIKPKLPAKVAGDIENAVKIGLNVVAYATGRELKDKLADLQIIQGNGERRVLDRGTLAIAKLMHSGGGDETPRSLENLQEIFRRETSSQVNTQSIKISASSPELEKYPIAYIHGRNRFTFNEDELKGLRTHFENGGVVLGDAICGSPEFSESVKKEFARVFKDARWIVITPDHPIMLENGVANGAFKLLDVSLIDPAGGTSSIESSIRNGPAELEALEWNGRLIMLYSPNDLSCALESKHSMQCRGYVRKDAFRIGFNMILYALTN